MIVASAALVVGWSGLGLFTVAIIISALTRARGLPPESTQPDHPWDGYLATAYFAGFLAACIGFAIGVH